jgi:redox-sensitive bicupin YhaK (pirin superfamily)
MILARRKATHARHYCEQPESTDKDGSKHWITRAANFVTIVSDAAEGAVLARTAQADEYMIFVVSGSVLVEAGAERSEAGDETLLIVPPGDSRVIVRRDARIVRVFSNQASDLLAAAGNASIYADGAPEITPITAWPDPVGGFKLRTYRLADFTSPDPSPLKMRLFRSTNLMINLFEPWTSRRDPSRLTPHSHDDFEQMSLGLKGSFRHHLRYPWGPDLTKWEDDEHV